MLPEDTWQNKTRAYHHSIHNYQNLLHVLAHLLGPFHVFLVRVEWFLLHVLEDLLNSFHGF